MKEGASMYIAYRCKRCGVTLIIPTEDVERMESQGRYIACPFGHTSIKKDKKYDDLKECMEKRNIYKREKGSVRQIK